MRGSSITTVWLMLLVLSYRPLNAQEKPRIVVGASSKTLGYSPLWVATKKGFFEQQGLDVQLVLLRGVPMTLQALAANSLQFGSAPADPNLISRLPSAGSISLSPAVSLTAWRSF